MSDKNFDDDVKLQHLHRPLNNEAGVAVLVEEMNAGDDAMTGSREGSRADKTPVLELKPFTEVEGNMLLPSTARMSSSENTLSNGNINPPKLPPEPEYTSPMEFITYLHQTVSRPTPHSGAFTAYTPPNERIQNKQSSIVVPTEGPLIQACKPESIGCKFLKGYSVESVIPSRCGHGCCSSSGSGQTSLLGPEFVEYEEISPFSNHELATIAADLNTVAWVKSGLEKPQAQTHIALPVQVLIQVFGSS